MREHEHEVTVGVCSVRSIALPSYRGTSGDARDDEETELADQHGAKRPERDLSGRPESDSPEAEGRFVLEADALERPDEDESLGDDAESGGAGDESNHLWCPRVESVRRRIIRAEDQSEGPESDDRHDIIENGCPHVRSEGRFRIEHLAQQRVEPEEEDRKSTRLNSSQVSI